MDTSYIDLHCHPTLKPYSKSFKYDPQKFNDPDPNRKNSIWHYSPPTVLEKMVNRLVTLTKFSQTDLTSLAKAKTKIVIVSLYPFEKHFLTKRLLGWKGITDLLVNLAASISQERIDDVLSHKDYFADLIFEYNYLKQLHNQAVKVEDITYTYRVVKNQQEIDANFQRETATQKIINILITIEGGHSFNTGLFLDKNSADPNEVKANVLKVKAWDHKPLFITLAHHFYNELCGHARSISIGALKKNQDRGLGSSITPLGFEVIDMLLDDTNGKRILIDIKHMSLESRKTFYGLLDTTYKNETIPLIASHGAANGYRSVIETDITDYPEMVPYLNNIKINFYDDELLRIARTNGLFGIQLDERRIGSKKAIRKSKIIFPNKRKQLRKKSVLVWRQIEHIARVLDKENLFCWGIQCIGSDFDGIVDPINGFWTAENIKDMAEELINRANEFLDINRNQLKPFNRLTAEVVVERVLRVNASEFIKKNY